MNDIKAPILLQRYEEYPATLRESTPMFGTITATASAGTELSRNTRKVAMQKRIGLRCEPPQ